jgi:integrase
MSVFFGGSRVLGGLIICGSYGTGYDNRNRSGWRLPVTAAGPVLGERTWTVLGKDHRMVKPAEEYLEYLRAQQASPNTVTSYARALALWWQYLDAFDLRWDAVTLADFGGFLNWLRTGDQPEVARRSARFAESTIAARLRAVISCYDYHVLNGVDVGRDLHRITHRGGGRYKPLLEHIARRKGRRQTVIRVRHRRQGAPPILTPQQIERIYEACANWDTDTRECAGRSANRLLWMLLAETGVRLGEALGLQHRDWHTERGDTPFIEVVARDHPHAVRAKSGYRRLYVSDELDRLYGEYVWRLCAAGADLATSDFDATYVFVNLDREPRFAPWRPESVYDLVDRLRRQLSGQVPQAWTPHWMHHSHATALLLSGVPVHVVSRRLGHTDVQTTLNTYANPRELHQMIKLMQAIEERVCDQSVLTLLRAILRAGVMEDGQVRRPVTGAPQGGVISPLLCNVYLHRIDRVWDTREYGCWSVSLMTRW